MSANDRKPNRLAAEASPYLLQHARNPVDWWPWCTEALEEAKRRDVPILLSVGYSACHWCHVMEKESFEDEATARVMNERFVSIKVDREERPDLDQIYQLVVQLMGRSGGWPLTVFLTPAQKPFFAGTYFPPEDRYGMPSFTKVLSALSEAYRTQRDEIEGQAAQLVDAVSEIGRRDTEDDAYAPSPDLLERAAGLLLRRFDAANGGFGRAPKFPNTMPLEVLLRRGVLENDGASRDAARLMLESMRLGGIWDQLGGGFHRYSTDERWLVPHFEKMLYDNALLLRSYVDGHRAFGEPLFADTAKALLQYVAREMTDAEGGLYASQDADSEGEEGKFFVWDEAGVRDALTSASVPGADRATKLLVDHFGITMAGNFEDHGRPTFMTVLHVARPIGAVAAKHDLPAEETRRLIDDAVKALFAARERRPKPFRDEKILTSWNALMISAMAEAAMALGDAETLAAAERAFDFAAKYLVATTNGALRALRLAKNVDGRWLVKEPGFLDDHAFLANAALDLYEATGDPAKVAMGRQLADFMLAAFYDEEEGFFFTAKGGEELITRSKDPYDNAVPGGASMAVRALLRLGALVADDYRKVAERELLRIAPAAVANPFAYSQTICELDRLVRGAVDVVLVGPRTDERTKALARATFSKWLPIRTVAWLDPNDPASREACALLAEGKAASTEPVAYVCRDRTCSLPVIEPAALLALL